MKLKSTLLAATVVMFAASTATAFAADVHDSNTGTEKAETVKAEKAEVKKPVKRHNHMEEKTGMPMSEAPSGKSHRESMPKDMPMHDHTQDRK
jgi:hypothetical protein